MKATIKILKILLYFLIVPLLTGCFRGEIMLDIHPDGSATIGGSYGVTSEAKLLLSMQGFDFHDVLFGDKLNDDFRSSSWVEGNYEWVKVERDYQSFDEVIDAFKMANDFTLTQKKGLFQNRITLNVVFDLSANNNESLEIMGMDMIPSDMLGFRFLARLPGTIKQKNGIIDIYDPNLIAWNLDTGGTTHIYAESVSWNYLNIGVFAVGILLIIARVVMQIVIEVRARQMSVFTESPIVDSDVNISEEQQNPESGPAQSNENEN